MKKNIKTLNQLQKKNICYMKLIHLRGKGGGLENDSLKFKKTFGPNLGKKERDVEKEKETKTILLKFQYAGGNEIELDNVLFGKFDLNEKRHIHATERYLNPNVRISGKGGFIRDTIGAIQDRDVKIEFFELKNTDIELVAKFLAENLPLVKKEKLSLSIGGTKVLFLENEIKKHLEKSLKKESS